MQPPEGARSGRSGTRRDVSAPSHFKVVLATVVGLIVFFALLDVVVLLWVPPSDGRAGVMSLCDFAVKGGLGALFGLIGGRSIR